MSLLDIKKTYWELGYARVGFDDTAKLLRYANIIQRNNEIACLSATEAMYKKAEQSNDKVKARVQELAKTYDMRCEFNDDPRGAPLRLFAIALSLNNCIVVPGTGLTTRQCNDIEKHAHRKRASRSGKKVGS